MGNVLRLRARAGLLFPNLQHEESGKRSFVGHTFKIAAKGPAPDGSQDTYGFAFNGETLEVPADDKHAAEYAKACADGDLIPADAATAALCTKLTGRPMPAMAADAPSKSADAALAAHEE